MIIENFLQFFQQKVLKIRIIHTHRRLRHNMKNIIECKWNLWNIYENVSTKMLIKKLFLIKKINKWNIQKMKKYFSSMRMAIIKQLLPI